MKTALVVKRFLTPPLVVSLIYWRRYGAKVSFRGGQAAFLGQPSELLGGRFARFARRAGLGVVDEGAGAALREDLGNAAAHGAGPGHPGHEVAAVGI